MNLAKHPYSEHFSMTGAAERYRAKFANRVDQLRHTYEVGILAPRLHGSLFDCTIATGRFVDQLPAVKSYAGMDYSGDFVSYIRSNFSNVDVHQGDLRNRIDQDDSKFDSSICLRTLSSLGFVENVVSEMLRITKPGGLVVFDYGTKTRSTTIRGTTIPTSNSDIPTILNRLGVNKWETIRLDGLLYQMKKRPWLARAFSGIADSKILEAERRSVRWMADRVLYLIRNPK